MRWAQGDALERITDKALLFNELPAWPADGQTIDYSQADQRELCADPQRLARFYALLSSAHYRTSPLDLRRLMDAPGMHFGLAQAGQEVVGAVWLVDEGGLSAELAHDVWAGRRRPRGNLVAQSLAAHGGQWWAPTLRSRRITRIATLPALRRQGIARQLVERQRRQAQGLDFLSVSFGYTEPLWRFWQSCGFELVRIGSKPEASSGCYTAMAILPLSEQGRGAAARGAQASGARLAPGYGSALNSRWRSRATTATRRWAKRIGASWPGSLSPIGRWRPAWGHCSVCCWPAICRCPRCAAICNGGNPRRPARSRRASAGRKPCCATGGTKRRRRWNS